MQSLLFILRQLWSRPAFTFLCVSTLAIGIGSNVTVFSIVNAVLMRPFPIENPSELYVISMYDPKQGSTPRGSMSYLDFDDFNTQSQSFSTLFGMFNDNGVLGFSEGAKQVQTSVVSPNFLETLGVQPILGRSFTESDGNSSNGSTLLISHRIWQSWFGSTRDLSTLILNLNGQPSQVLGVMPPGFLFPVNSDVWIPLKTPVNAQRGSRYLRTYCRIKPEVTRESASAEVQGIAQRITNQFPETHRDLTATLYPLKEVLLPSNTKLMLFALMGAVGCVLAIAASNVASLILVRGLTRQKELAIRSSLGAGQSHLIFLLIGESLVLSCIGGFLGLLFSTLALKGILSLIPETLPFWIHFSIDTSVVLFTVVISLVTGLLSGFIPAWKVIRQNPLAALKNFTSAVSLTRREQWIRNALVTGEVAASVALLIGAGLMTRTFLATQTASLGFQTQDRFCFELSIPKQNFPTSQDQKHLGLELLSQLGSLPDVESVGFLQPALPLSYTSSSSYFTAQQGQDEDAVEAGLFNVLGPALETLGVQLFQGRFFQDSDYHSPTRMCLINRTLASRLFPNSAPLGQRVRYRGSPPEEAFEVIGVVNDLRRNSIHDPAEGQIYFPYGQNGWAGGMSAVLSSRASSTELEKRVHRTLSQVNSSVVAFNFQPFSHFVSKNISYWMSRLNGWMFSFLGLIAILVTVTGLHGLVGFSVRQRSRELALRLAMGSQRSQLLKMILIQTGAPVALGLVIGLGLAFLLSQLLESLLFGVTPLDPFIYGLTVVLVCLAAFSAFWGPALRLSRLDPAILLRAE